MKRYVFALCMLLVSCSKPNETLVTNYDYSDVTTQIDWYDTFNQEENDYLVYYYNETCSHCNSIKQNVISYYLADEETMYFVNTKNNSRFGPVKELKGIDDIELFYIFGTPFLIRVKDYKIEDYYSGVNKILEYLNR